MTKLLTLREIFDFSTNKFLDDLSKHDWNNDPHDTNQNYNNFFTKLVECTNRYAPIRKLNRKEMKLKSKPWITPLIQKKIKHRNRLFARKKMSHIM